MKKVSKDKLFTIFAIITIIIICPFLVLKLIQNDTFYSIKLGDYIVHNGIDFMDHFSWISNLPYTYPHWLFNIIIYVVFILFNLKGIYLFTIIFFIILMLIFFYINKRLNHNSIMSFISTIFVMFNIYFFICARAQLISYSLFLLDFYFIIKLLKTGKKKYILLLSFDSLIVANIHGTAWLFTFVIYLPFFAHYFAYKVINSSFIKKYKLSEKVLVNKIKVTKLDNVKLLLIAFIISFAMGLLTPSRICYTYIIKTMMGDSTSYIQEHMPIYILNQPSFIIITILFLFIFSFSKIKIELYDLFMFCGITFMSISSLRHMALMLLINTIILTKYFVLLLKQIDISFFDKVYNFINKHIIVYIIFLICILTAGFIQYNSNKSIKYISKNVYPVDATIYIKDNLNQDDLRLFNEYDDGSYLMYNDIKVMVDSRCDLYLKEFNNMNLDVFDDVNNIIYNYNDVFKNYNINYALVKNHGILYKELILEKSMNEIYKDDYYSIFKVN